MKRIAMVFTATIMLFASSAFALDGDKVTARVKAAFQTDFSGASQVSWEKTSDFYFATFQLNNVRVDAAYNEEGELLGTSRKIDATQLPLSVTMELAKKYGDFTKADHAYELNFEGQTSYYITVKNSRQELSLKCYANGEINVESRSKK